MNFNLTKVLISKKLISTKTEIDAYVDMPMFNSKITRRERKHFLILKIYKDNDFFYFDCEMCNRKEIKLTFKNTDIVLVDGMLPERYAAAFYLNPEGNPL